METIPAPVGLGKGAESDDESLIFIGRVDERQPERNETETVGNAQRDLSNAHGKRHVWI
jgi:hypothetical protein